MSEARSAYDDSAHMNGNADYAGLDGQPSESLLSVSCEIGLSPQRQGKVDHRGKETHAPTANP